MALFRVLCASLAAWMVLAVDQPENMAPTACASYKIPQQDYEKFHGDQVCNRAEYNTFKGNLGRGFRVEELKKTHAHIAVPNQRTVVCPLEVQDLKEGPRQGHGLDTIWLVENTSKDPIVLSFVKEGVEYSAVNPKITPPHDDPQAILPPRKHTSVAAFEGHIFHARTLDTKSNTLGPVVLQYRAGLIPVGEKFQDLECPSDDPEPLKPQTTERAPQFARTNPKIDRPCNTIDVGFRNMANCPLNGYFVTSNNQTSCQEKFKFHLGKNPAPADFFWGWDSPTKFEGSFVGHTFAFRSAANPNIVVDQITLRPTRVIDCPELKEKLQTNRVTTVGDLVDVFSPISDRGIVGKEALLEHALLHGVRDLASFWNETNSFENTTAKEAVPRRRRSLATRDPQLLGIQSA